MKNENIEGEIFGYKVPLGVETTLSFMPLVGTAMDAYNLYKEPSWENAMHLGISAAAEIPFLKWLKAGKVLK